MQRDLEESWHCISTSVLSFNVCTRFGFAPFQVFEKAPKPEQTRRQEKTPFFDIALGVLGPVHQDHWTVRGVVVTEKNHTS